MKWEVVIGLEVHTQLQTCSKIFSSSATAYGAVPNSQADLVDLGFPGVLPVLNQKAVEMALKFGLAIKAHINRESAFDRKLYFYPDLPKGYQISQFHTPIVGAGFLDVELDDGSIKRIGITRAHLEEDAGKSLHDVYQGMTGIDLNRAGTPLLEIVSDPDMRSAAEAVAYLKTLHSLVTYLGICDGNMQEGSFRCDANVSVRLKGASVFGTRAEIKNVNSFRYVEKAINYEIERQIELLESGGSVVQETRLYDSSTNSTRSMRSKEEANDYRYFPDPDLLMVQVDDAMLTRVQADLPELPWHKQTRLQQQYGLNAYDAKVLSSSRPLADYFETVVATGISAKLATNWVMGDLSALLNKHYFSIGQSPVDAIAFAALLKRIEDGTISGKTAKIVFEAMWDQEGSADCIIEARGFKQVSDSGALEKIIDEIIAANPSQLAEYRSGKDKLFGFFVGLAMKASRGQANPQQLNDLLKQRLM